MSTDKPRPKIDTAALFDRFPHLRRIEESWGTLACRKDLMAGAFLAGRSMMTRPTEACDRRFFRYSRTFRSSCSIWAKLPLLANQREAQSRVTDRRNPVG